MLDRVCPDCHAVNQPFTVDGECFNCVVQKLPGPRRIFTIAFATWLVVGLIGAIIWATIAK